MSDIEYLERVKVLQGDIRASEQKRLQLEQELEDYCRNRQQQNILKSNRLREYWDMLCRSEEEHQARNSKLLHDIRKMESRLAASFARTDNLRRKKEEYERYIDKKYPNWRSTTQDKPNEGSAGKNVNNRDVKHMNPSRTDILRESRPDVQPISSTSFQKSTRESPTLPERFTTSASVNRAPTTVIEGQELHNGRLPTSGSRLPAGHYENVDAISEIGVSHQLTAQHTANRYGDRVDDVTGAGVSPSSQQEAVSVGSNVSDTQNTTSSPKTVIAADAYKPTAKDVRYSGSGRPTSVVVSPKLSNRVAPQASTGEPRSSRTDAQSDRSVVSPMSELSRRSDEHYDEIQTASSRDAFGAKRKGVVRFSTETLQKDDGVDDGDVAASHETPPFDLHLSLSMSSKSGSAAQASLSDLTTSGLFVLLAFLDTELRANPNKKKFYHSSSPEESVRRDYVLCANKGDALSHLNPVTASMVVLDSLQVLAASQPGECVIDDATLKRAKSDLSDLERSAPELSTRLWRWLLRHFVALVRAGVMTEDEVGQTFAPSLINQNSRFESPAIYLVTRLVTAAVAAKLDDTGADEFGESRGGGTVGTDSDSVGLVTPRVPAGGAGGGGGTEPFSAAGGTMTSIKALAGSFYGVETLEEKDGTDALNVTANDDLRLPDHEKHLHGKYADVLQSESSSEEEVEEMKVPPYGVSDTHTSHTDDSTTASPVSTGVLKESDAYKSLVGSARLRSQQSSMESEEDDIEAVVSNRSAGGRRQPTLQSLLEAKESPKSLSDRTESSRDLPINDPLESTKNLLKSVASNDSDLDADAESARSNVGSEAKKNNDDDYFDFYQ